MPNNSFKPTPLRGAAEAGVRHSPDDGFAILRQCPEVLNISKSGTSSPSQAVSAEITHDGER
jgi:hypothetical protein